MKRRNLPFSSMFVLLAALGATGAEARSIQEDDAPQVYRSAAFMGRGDTGIATADDEDSLFYNPAGLALFERPPLAKNVLTRFPTFEENINPKADDRIYKRAILASPMVEGSESLRELKDGNANPREDPIGTARTLVGKNVHAGANQFTGLILRRVGFGAYGSARADGLLFKNKEYGGLETAAARVDAYTGFTGGIAQDFADGKVLVGAAYRTIYRGKAHAFAAPGESPEDLKTRLDFGEEIGTGKGQGGDVGLMLRSPKFKYRDTTMRLAGGVLVRDAGGTRIVPDHDPSPDLDIPQTVNLGLAWDIGTRGSHIRLLADYRDVTQALDLTTIERSSLGAELWLSSNLGLTTGMHEGYASGGLFLDFTLLRFDLGVYSEEMGEKPGDRQDRRYFARVTLGF